MRHLRFVLFRRFNFVSHWVLEELANELVDATVKSCGEQQTLSFTWCLLKNACDVLEETKLCHVVGFVQDGAFDCIKLDLAGLHEVNETTRTCNNDVDTVAHCVDLAGVAHAAINGGGAHVECFSQWLKYVTNLVCKFTGGYQDDGTGAEAVTTTTAVVQTGEHWKAEREGLARASAAAAERVTTRKSVGDGGLLNGEWCQNALRCQDIN